MSPGGALDDVDRRVLGALAKLGGTAAPGELWTRSELPERTFRRRRVRLEEAGLLVGDKRAVRLTSAGWDEVGRATLPPPASAFETVVRELLPVPHAAFVRLLADAIVCRHLAPGRAFHPSFGAGGSPGMGKTFLAEFICDAFGWERSAMVRRAAALAPGEVLGRRFAEPGGYRFEPSPITRLSFVCFDEWAEAEPEVRRAILRMLHGERVVTVEDDRVELSPVAMVTFNPSPGAGDPRRPLPESYWRRCLILHPDAAAGVEQLPGRLARYDADRAGRLIDLRRLGPPSAGLPAAVDDLLSGFAEQLTASGRMRYGDRRTVEACVLGRAARIGTPDDLRAVAVAVTVDLLTLAETVPGELANPEWEYEMDVARRVLATAPGFDHLAAALEAHEEARRETTRRQQAKRVEAEAISLELVGDRDALSEVFRQAQYAIRTVPVQDRPAAKGLRSQLSDLARKAAQARSAEALSAVDALGAPVLQRAAAMRDRIVAERAQSAEAETKRKRDEKAATERRRADDVARRKAIATSDRAARRDAAEQRKALLERERYAGQLRRLLARKTTKPDEDVAARLVELGCLELRREERWDEPFLPGLRKWLSGTEPGKVRQIVTVYVDATGRRYGPEMFAFWQHPATRAALKAAIAQLEERPLLPAVASRARDQLGDPFASLQETWGIQP